MSHIWPEDPQLGLIREGIYVETLVLKWANGSPAGV